jgi:hypothetical protein
LPPHAQNGHFWSVAGIGGLVSVLHRHGDHRHRVDGGDLRDRGHPQRAGHIRLLVWVIGGAAPTLAVSATIKRARQ